jgi:Na+/melibiose symporter-like transporter
LSCVLYVASFFGLSIFGCPFGSLKTLLTEAQQSRKRKG